MLATEHLQASLQALFTNYATANDAIEVIAIATTDGFPVHHYSRNPSSFETDTLAAAASTLYSVSDAVARQILGKRFKVTFIEAEQGNVAFVALGLAGRDYVLVMSAQQSMNIANVRLLINRLANEIAELGSSAVA